MKYICHDCGYEIPEDMEFCPHCGCMRDKSTPVDDQTGMPLGVCPSCGAKTNPGDSFCGSCGAALPEVRVMVPKMRKNGTLAIILGLFPGFFNIFGLGHLVMREWSKGAMFLAFGDGSSMERDMNMIFAAVLAAMAVGGSVYLVADSAIRIRALKDPDTV